MTADYLTQASHYYNEYFVKPKMREQEEKRVLYEILLKHTHGKNIIMKASN